MPGILKQTEIERVSNALVGIVDTNLSSGTVDVPDMPQCIQLTALQRLSILAAIIAFQDSIDDDEESDSDSDTNDSDGDTNDSNGDTDDSDSDWEDFYYFHSSAPFRRYSMATATASFGNQVIDELKKKLLAQHRLRRSNKNSINYDTK